MYLVHVHVRPPTGASVPEGIGAWVRDLADPGHVEHVSVHAGAFPHPILGVYLLASHLEQAEEVAVTACRRVLDTRPELRGWQVAEGYVPLLAPVYDAPVDDSLGADRADRADRAGGVRESREAGTASLDGTVQGRFRPHRSPSPGPELEES
ncbi:hypothetical protein [Streptomyces cinereoruber]|uniref:hypothetical protein n=1 Tax=Streptomyces cinereoruber TaxID=67260 RepID=UPI00363F48DA